MTSYQTNFAIYHTCDPHVGFLLAWNGIGKHNNMSHYLGLHTTIPNYNRVTRISAHTLGGKFESFCEVNQKFQHFCSFFSSISCHTKGNQAAGQNRACIGVYGIVQTLYKCPGALTPFKGGGGHLSEVKFPVSK